MIDAMVEEIAAARRRTEPQRSVLAAVSGIDGCGKGFVTARIVEPRAAATTIIVNDQRLAA